MNSMRIHPRTALLALLAVAACAQTAAAQRAEQAVEKTRRELGDSLAPTAEEVIERAVEAMGGREALQAVGTFRFRGENLNLGGETRPLERFLDRSGRLRQQTPGADGYLLGDGAKVWSVGSRGRTELDAAWRFDLIHCRIDQDFLDWAERGIVCEYLGLTGFETEPTVAYHLRRAYPDGHVEELFIDVRTHLLRATYVPATGAFRVYYDFRDVGGIPFPHLWLRIFGERTPPHPFVVTEAAANEDFGDGFFE